MSVHLETFRRNMAIARRNLQIEKRNKESNWFDPEAECEELEEQEPEHFNTYGFELLIFKCHPN